MTATLQLLLLAASVTYIVDVSGFTESWRALLARVLHIRPDQLRALPPFDCGKCATLGGPPLGSAPLRPPPPARARLRLRRLPALAIILRRYDIY